MSAYTQTTNQTKNTDRERVYKLFQAIAEYGHRIRTGQKTSPPNEAASTPKTTRDGHAKPAE